MSGTLPHPEVILRALRDAVERQVREWPDRASGFNDVMRLTADLARVLLASADTPTNPASEALAERALSRGVFLGGSPKGGTTMFVQLFDGHPDLVVLPGDSRLVHLIDAPPEETALERQLGYWLRQTISPNALPPFWCLGESLDPYRALASWYKLWHARLASRPAGCVLAAAAALACATRPSAPAAFVEKTCANVQHAARVFAAMPGAKIIQIVRDPYATLAALSRQVAARRWDWTFQSRLDMVRDVLRGAVENPARFGEDRYRVVAYERLVADPEPVMRSLAAFIGVDYHPILTTPTVLGRPATSNSMFGERRVTGQLLAEDPDETIDRWRQVLTPAEQRSALDACSPFAEQLGYRVSLAA